MGCKPDTGSADAHNGQLFLLVPGSLPTTLSAPTHHGKAREQKATSFRLCARLLPDKPGCQGVPLLFRLPCQGTACSAAPPNLSSPILQQTRNTVLFGILSRDACSALQKGWTVHQGFIQFYLPLHFYSLFFGRCMLPPPFALTTTLLGVRGELQDHVCLVQGHIISP